jgi:hypothetical protein
MEIATRVGPANHHAEVLRIFPDHGVADGRLELIAVVVDPALKVEWR